MTDEFDNSEELAAQQTDNRVKNPNSLKNLKRFGKEVEPYRGGRKKGTRNKKTLINKYLKVKVGDIDGLFEGMNISNATAEDAIVVALFHKAFKGDIGAFKEIYDRAYGKVTQKIDLDVKDVRDMSDEELDAILES